jgi:hypothetical protein
MLLPLLAALPDPRARCGVCHRLAVILGLARCAVLVGAQSFTAIAEWAADADQTTRDELRGHRPGAVSPRSGEPCSSWTLMPG